ncbi:MAG: TadE/TadG family type IV pilus assembly protein, partial [Myxococcales bacterium]
MLIGHMRRTMREDEAGQALVLGALTMLVLALSVMVTVQLGWTINRRIQLQNAADNSAFSTSAAVARCMNFIAWMNRTSVAHYVSMMAFQSYASFFTGVQTIMFLFADLVQQIAAMACVIEKAAAALKNLPYVGAIFAAIEIAFKIIRVACENGAKVLYGIVKSTWEAVDLLDKACAAAIQAISWLNQNAMWLLAKAIKEGMLAMLAVDALGGFQDRILQETACRDGSNCVNTGGTGTAYKGVMAAVNAAFSYRNIFDRYGSEAIPDGGTEARGDGYEVNDSVQNAERLMAELANGSRAGDGHAHGGIVTETFRGFNKESAGGLGSVAEYIGFKFQGSTRLTGSMDCSTFHEGTGKCDGQSASTAVEPPRPDTGRCDSLGKQCDKETKEAEEAQEECDSANAACSASGDPNSEACTDAIDKCDKAAGKREDAEDTCDRAEDACDPGTGIIGGGGVDGSNGKKNYVFEVGEDTSVTTRGSVIASADYVKASGLTLFTGAGGRMTGIQTNSNE